VKNLFDDLASSAFAFGLAGRFTEHRVRVLAYHAIGDGEKFAAQMNEIRRSFRPISSDDLLRALEGNADVPERSIWITFDDGDTSVIDIALPTLIALGLPSTLFVCPGVVNSREPYWWQIVEESVRRRVEPEHWRLGHDSAAAIRILKELPDTDRRRIVDSVRAVLERTSSQPYEEQQITDDQLRHYIRNGGSVGNHTWDHPCLDTCSPEEQDKQIKLDGVRLPQWKLHEARCGYTGRPRIRRSGALRSQTDASWRGSVSVVTSKSGYAQLRRTVSGHCLRSTPCGTAITRASI
jgi:peptidoglycan/xylan/chitin deacetylase (PgdA/CDA1 family)